MQRVVLTVTKNEALTPLIYEMHLAGDVSGVTRAGQFVEIALDGLYLRRPISVCNYEEGELTLIYKVVGKGTDLMSQMAEGTQLDVLTGLGNGFNIDHECEKPLLVGGGVGVPPLYRLTRDLIARGKEVTVVLGFNTESEIFYAEKFEEAGAKVIIATADGSVGIKGFVTNAIAESGVDADYFYSC
ncbi:MAG: dihydroorotate dehydrogenase electron transfer subunit, partial [Alistipes sp.]|nr:dihydroorotate dehydrogenase electron transfer subunit [Alistipes sp.]